MNIDDYMLGDPQFHDDLHAAAEILLEFISTAPRSLSAERLARYTGRTIHDITPICRALESEGLLRQDLISRYTWSLMCDPGAVTMEDAFRATLAAQRGSKLRVPRQSTSTTAPDEVELLLIQATIGISHNLFTYLRKIRLGRPRCVESGMAITYHA